MDIFDIIIAKTFAGENNSGSGEVENIILELNPEKSQELNSQVFSLKNGTVKEGWGIYNFTISDELGVEFASYQNFPCLRESNNNCFGIVLQEIQENIFQYIIFNYVFISDTEVIMNNFSEFISTTGILNMNSLSGTYFITLEGTPIIGSMVIVFLDNTIIHLNVIEENGIKKLVTDDIKFILDENTGDWVMENQELEGPSLRIVDTFNNISDLVENYYGGDLLDGIYVYPSSAVNEPIVN